MTGMNDWKERSRGKENGGYECKYTNFVCVCFVCGCKVCCFDFLVVNCFLFFYSVCFCLLVYIFVFFISL